jgi:hypothetical protein
LPRPKDLASTSDKTVIANRDLKTLCQLKSYLHFNATYKAFPYINKPRLGLFANDLLHLSYKGSAKIAQIMKHLAALWKQGRLSFE